MLRRSPDAVWERLGEATLVLDPEQGRYVRLNRSGAVLWEALAEPADETSLARVLTERYGLEASEAARDVAAFVAGLRERGLVGSA